MGLGVDVVKELARELRRCANHNPFDPTSGSPEWEARCDADTIKVYGAPIAPRWVAWAEAVLARLDALGLVVVPATPTEAMIDAGHECGDWGPGINCDEQDAGPRNCWQAMILAGLSP